MTPEGKLKAEFKRRVQALSPHVWGFMPVSIGMGIHGIPDWVGLAHGTFIAAELKATGGKVKKIQELTQQRIIRAGGIAWIVDPSNIDDFFIMLEGVIEP